MNFKNKNIWIIGCSSGIGEAVAKELAASGATLALSARRETKLNKICNNLEGKHTVLPLDISNPKEVKKAVESLRSKWKKIDIIINFAALYYPGDMVKLESTKTKKLIEVNLTSSFYLAEYALPHLIEQGEGQLVFCGSVAGYMGLPGGQPYSATKAAIINMSESLYLEMKKSKTNVDIKLINPGFVKTPMTEKNDFEMPMVLQPEQAAKAISKGLLASKFEIHFPRKFTNIMKFLEILPYGIYFRLAKKIV